MFFNLSLKEMLNKFTVRPSGTEPKIKYYLYVKEETKEKADKALKEFGENFVKFVDSLI